MDALKFIEPILNRVREFAAGHKSAGECAGRSQSLARLGTQAVERLVAQQGDEVEVLVHEDGDGDAPPAADFDLLGEFGVLVAIDEANANKPGGVGAGEVVEDRALLHAVAAPDTGTDEDVDLAGEACDE